MGVAHCSVLRQKPNIPGLLNPFSLPKGLSFPTFWGAGVSQTTLRLPSARTLLTLDCRAEGLLNGISPCPFLSTFYIPVPSVGIIPMLPTSLPVCDLQGCCHPAEQDKELEQENMAVGR